MSYGFNGTSDQVEFGRGPINGAALGPYTFAVLLKRNSVGVTKQIGGVFDSAITSRLGWGFSSANVLRALSPLGASNGQTLSSTSLWYLIAVTCAAGTATPRFHVHDGTSWNHAAGSANSGAITVAGTDRVFIGTGGSAGPWFPGDIVCTGIKKADSADLTVETLSRTLFSAWVAFGFDWLIGFDSSLESAGILQDQASPGTGDEIGISGTTVVSDPPGWSWATTVPSTFVPRIAIIS